jgi:hypothetical protein
MNGCADSLAPPKGTPRIDSVPDVSKCFNSAQAEVRPPADKSLALDEYIKAGVPASDRHWAGDDMARAAAALATMAGKDSGSLPRYGSPRSGQLFDRITADDNLELHRNGSLPLSLRLPDVLKYMEAENKIFKLYLGAFNTKAAGDREMVELAGTQLRLSVVVLRLVGEFMPTLKKDDPTYPVRMNGLKQMRAGLAEMVLGNLKTLTESQFFRTTELKRLAGYLQDTLPSILPELPPASRSETLVVIRSYLADPKMQYLKPELNKLLDSLHETKGTDKSP